MIIAVDFDGTIVEHRFPTIGRTRPNAFKVLKALQERNHRLILWTYRSGTKLDEAIQFCRSHGLEFYAVNKNFPEEEWDKNDSRKILADMYIDDRNFGGIPSWIEIFKAIYPEEDIDLTHKDKPWWKRR
jgi:hydroxymethylpyrimidine pyrophosphatase-like HAD family hydrolase